MKTLIQYILYTPKGKVSIQYVLYMPMMKSTN